MKYVLDRFSFYVLLTKLTTVLHCILLCDVIMNGPVQLAGFALSPGRFDMHNLCYIYAGMAKKRSEK